MTGASTSPGWFSPVLTRQDEPKLDEKEKMKVEGSVMKSEVRTSSGGEMLIVLEGGALEKTEPARSEGGALEKLFSFCLSPPSGDFLR